MIVHSPAALKYKPARIISLVPSQTELLFQLQLEEQVVGITKFCIYPETWKSSKTIIGGTKNINLEKIKQLNPDLIIANKEENEKQQMLELAKDYPVWITDVSNLGDSLKMIEDVGVLTHSNQPAQTLIEGIQSAFNSLIPIKKPLNCCYVIWKNPYMVAAAATFINDMLQRCGLQNMFAGINRYPEINIENLKEQHCDLLILSTEPYPFTQVHVNELQEQLPETKIIIADGEMFSWYGSRLLLAPAYFKKLIATIETIK